MFHVIPNPSPARPLNARKVASHSLQSEVVLCLISIECHSFRSGTTYSCHLEVAEHTTRVSPHRTSVANLRRACVVAHLLELELGFGADTSGERGVSNDVSKSLPAGLVSEMLKVWPEARSRVQVFCQEYVPLRLELLKDHALRVVAHNTRGYMTA